MTIEKGAEILAEDMLNLRMFPVGTILIYHGSFTDNSTLKGWYKCDNQIVNGQRTPDLRDGFIRGGGTAGQTGGSNTATITLTVNNMPSHSHGVSGQTSAQDKNLTGNFGWGESWALGTGDIMGYNTSTRFGSGSGDTDDLGFEINANHTHTVTATVGYAGQSSPTPLSLDITPDSHKVIYIIRLA
ncbi:MAG: hypothetical protein LBD99_06730 [Candidatus Margulisbacteria bacterium]|jgi:hypothetical protein|nr:hypothetical protein [Candidatus Margulisiibacteriota bacterium]